MLIEFFADKAGPKIIGGDFNLLPETKSVRTLEASGYRDPIQRFNIETTRNRLTWERFPVKQLHSDCVFATPDVQMRQFQVPQNEIADHLPLVLEFEIS